MEMRRVFYECKCGNKDYTDTFGDRDPFPAALGCTKCKAGYGLTAGDQTNRQVGLIAKATEMWDTNDAPDPRDAARAELFAN